MQGTPHCTSGVLKDIFFPHCSLQEAKGSTRHVFEEKGVVVTSGKGTSLDTAEDSAIEVGAEEVTKEDEDLVVSQIFFRPVKCSLWESHVIYF